MNQYQNLRHDRYNICGKCHEKIEGAYAYEPKDDKKLHWECWVTEVRQRYDTPQQGFSPTEYPPVKR